MRNRTRGRRIGRSGCILPGTAPLLTSVVVQAGGASIVLTFNRAIDVVDSDAAGFYVHASGGDLDGSVGDISPSDGVTNSTTITWNSNIRVISAGETLTIDYRDTPIGRITDHATGRRLDNFGGRTVTNNA